MARDSLIKWIELELPECRSWFRWWVLKLMNFVLRTYMCWSSGLKID